VIEDIKILEAVERYISGQMSPDERVYFEQLRKTNPEVDHMVVEHTFFLQQMNRFDEVRNLKGILDDTHIHLAEKGLIKSPKLKGKARVVYLYNRYKRVAAIAASIAGITALTMSALVWSLSPGKPINDVKNDVELLKREINGLKKNDVKLDSKINDVKSTKEEAAITPTDTPIEYKSGGSGFLLDSRGYVVTNAHVVENAKHIAVQGSDGVDICAERVYIDLKRDIAIIRINPKKYKSPGAIPYSIRKTPADLSDPIYTLGFPRNEIVYGEGYVAAQTGYKGDSLALQITIAANQGNSGGPVFNRNGEVVGILTGKQTSAEGAVFALHSKYIYNALNAIRRDSSSQKIKIPSGTGMKGMDRTQQVKKLKDFVYMVKVD
jgi:S1-C subfamily serine protease